VITLDPDRALATAAARAEELAAGHSRGPLHGVAVGLKDIIDVAGLPTRCGSHVLADEPPAAADAEIVRMLTDAGAIVVAKLHTHEFAYGPTGDVSATGPARNPHDPTRITGGSSSGSAAAVAAGHLPLAIGTDTGCSIRTPAAHCGVFGLKPRYGALPTDGVFPLAESCDHVGLLAADARSASLAWDSLTGGAPAAAATGLVIGVPADDYWRPHDPVIADGVAVVSSAARAAGHTVIDVATPDITELASTYPIIVGAEAYTTHARWLAERPGDYQPITADRLLMQADLPAHVYVDAQRTRRRLTEELHEHLTSAGVHVLLLATTPLRATPIGERKEHGIAVRPALLSLNLPFNLTGWPAISMSGPVADGGLPMGVQLVGVQRDERTLLALAERLAAELGA
jgi:Asp-tRNA(Asn)/Glu-tRNA(Gln) amidotransferase A subunit family amidase